MSREALRAYLDDPTIDLFDMSDEEVMRQAGVEASKSNAMLVRAYRRASRPRPVAVPEIKPRPAPPSGPRRRCAACGADEPYRWTGVAWAAPPAHSCPPNTVAVALEPWDASVSAARAAVAAECDEQNTLGWIFPMEMRAKRKFVSAFDARTDLLRRFAARMEAHPGVADDLMAEAWALLDE